MYIKTQNLSTIKQNYLETCYLFNKDAKILLPITLPENCKTFPGTHDTLNRIICSLGGRVLGLKIYLERNDDYYAYLCVESNNKKIDLNINVTDGIKICDVAKKPIYVKDTIIQRNGLKVTKSMIEEALESV